jgi:VWFA-related protein
MAPVIRSAVAALVVAGIASTVVTGQSEREASASQTATDPSFISRATAVLVDVVVRDRQGRPLLDLKADDFELLEDGVRQDIGSFTLVSRGAGIGIDVKLKPRPDESTTVVTAAGTRDEPEPLPSAVALVFDMLSPEAMSLAQKAALSHIKMSGETEARIGVFASEPQVRVVQRYTTEPALVRKAVQQLVTGGDQGRDTRAERIEELRDRRRAMEAAGMSMDPGNSPLAGRGQNVAQIGQAEVERRLLQGEMRMLQAFETLDRDHRGYGITNALLAILETMAFLPGRKSVVYFSEGLPASPAMQAQLQSVIEAANRSNITIYTVDATGLKVQSTSADTRREVQAMGEDRLREVSAGLDRTDGPLMRVLERTEDLMRYQNETGLARLAEDTGGFLVQGTNDIGSGFRRIDEDMRIHYLLTYAPKNDVLDGKFRSIGVKVKRPNTTVFARSGYRAVRAPTGPVLAFEAPALAMLDTNPLPNAFRSNLAAFAFPEAERPGLTPIVVRVTTDNLAYEVDEARGAYNAQAAVVVRIRDEAGRIVQKLSQQYVLTGASSEIEGAKRGEILFYREPELDSGVYQVESIVYDAVAEKGSVRISTLAVPGAESPRLRMSSLVLVARTEQTQAQAVATTGPDVERKPPFYYRDTLLYPNVGETLQRGRDEALPFYFVVYPVPGRCACSAQIALLRNGQPIAEASRQLDTEDTGRLQHVGSLPIGDLPPGTYELRVTVTDSEEQQTRTAFFTVS